ncbi:glycine cleavage system aminomethyltransferase GcvT [Alicyclobacillus contaminans]|uniref:glycine cleavage system aminomethyltransferase GcvT n=1 Tax=Alicyclobacillus contaminans TaxID=392016 RepID=UPI0004790077|nr:glycine cleavage system aminomethyltransferase GcvT [Alicyclobacillus contaminans]
MAELRKTPLYPLYKQYGAKTVEFGGWDMPVQFSSILFEHDSVRQRAGLFDVSHMGEFLVTGRDARAFLQYMLTNDLSRLESGMAMYSPLANERGGCVDDVLVYCLTSDSYMVVVNAGNIEKDWTWLQHHADGFSVSLDNRSDATALLALQGPLSERILQKVTPADLSALKYYRFVQSRVCNASALVSRTGYTGEDGFELYLRPEDAADVWAELLSLGEPDGLVPCGLGARDTLRLEARLPLYGHELTEDISPLEAGLGAFVKLDKGDFVGKSALQSQKLHGLRRRVAGIVLDGRGIPRQGYSVLHQGRTVGQVTSGTMSPTLKMPIGLVLVEADLGSVGTELAVDIRGKQVAAKVVKTPFYKRSAGENPASPQS